MVSTLGDVRNISFDTCHFESTQADGTIMEFPQVAELSITNCHYSGNDNILYGIRFLRSTGTITRDVLINNCNFVKMKTDSAILIKVDSGGHTARNIWVGGLNKQSDSGYTYWDDPDGIITDGFAGYFGAGKDSDSITAGSSGNLDTGFASGVNGFVMPKGGSVTGLSVRTNNAPSAGSCTFTVRKNYSHDCGLSATIDSSNPIAQDFQSREQSSGSTFSAGDLIQIRFSADASWFANASGSDIIATMIVSFK